MKKRNTLNSPRLSELIKHRHRAVLNKILFSIFGLLLSFGILVYISRLGSLNINDIEIVGNKVIETPAIKTIAEQQISGKYLRLFPKTNLLIYPKNNIKNELQDKFKRLQNIQISVKNNNVLQISVSERASKYIWCVVDGPIPAESLVLDTGSQKCFYLDEDGFVIDEAPFFSGDVYFKFYGPSSLLISSPQGSYFSRQNFKQLISFSNILDSLGLKPVAIYIGDNGDIEVFISNGSSALMGPRIMFSADSDFQNVAENLETALTTEPLASEFKNKFSALQYIDLRYGNKVYYKFR
jgi:cell division septal protein FtsQ